MPFFQVLDLVSKGMPYTSNDESTFADLLYRYVLFSIGNLTPLFDAVWPQCWSKYTVCNKKWVDAVTYLEIVGIMVGQVLVGALGDG